MLNIHQQTVPTQLPWAGSKNQDVYQEWSALYPVTAETDGRRRSYGALAGSPLGRGSAGLPKVGNQTDGTRDSCSSPHPAVQGPPQLTGGQSAGQR